MPSDTDWFDATRRRFLEATTTAGALAGTAGLSAAGDDESTADDHDDGDAADDESAAEQDEADDVPDDHPAPPGPTIGLETVASDIAPPTGLTVADEDRDRRFVTTQTGQILVHDADGLQDEPFLDVSDRMIDVGMEEMGNFDERGLLGLEFHPEFADNGRFFVRYSAPHQPATPSNYSHTFRLSEFETAGDDNDTADPDSETVLLEIPEPQFNHAAGDIAFGPDGYLYVANGDGGDQADTGLGHVDQDWYPDNEGGNAQDTSSNLQGGIFRIDVDSEGEDKESYAIPDDNPFADQPEEQEEHVEEYYAWGFRNVWGMAFDDDGNLFAAQPGERLYEWVELVEQGGNYGWNVREGTHCFNAEDPLSPPDACPTHTPDDVRDGEPLRDPIAEYPQTYDGEALGSSVIGGYRYETDTVPELEGDYVFGDWSAYEPFLEDVIASGEEDPAGKLFVARAPDEIEPPGAPPSEDEAVEDGGGTHRQDDLWEMEELQVAVDRDEFATDGQLDRYVWAFGRDADGDVYVLTANTWDVEAETGAIHRIVPESEVT